MLGQVPRTQQVLHDDMLWPRGQGLSGQCASHLADGETNPGVGGRSLGFSSLSPQGMVPVGNWNPVPSPMAAETPADWPQTDPVALPFRGGVLSPMYPYSLATLGSPTEPLLSQSLGPRSLCSSRVDAVSLSGWCYQ